MTPLGEWRSSAPSPQAGRQVELDIGLFRSRNVTVDQLTIGNPRHIHVVISLSSSDASWEIREAASVSTVSDKLRLTSTFTSTSLIVRLL